MKHLLRWYAFLWILLVAALSGCGNPAANKPQALVNDPIPQEGRTTEAVKAAADSTEVVAPGESGEVGAPMPPLNEPTRGTRYVFGPEPSRLDFVGSKVTGKHHGGFHEFSGEIFLVDGKPENSAVTMTIMTDSIWTDTERLTNHLKSADFFDVATYPTAAFTSTSIVPEGDHYQVSGNLTLHGVTKNITFPAQIHVEGNQIHAEAEFVLKRFDFGIVYPGKADDLIRDEVVVKLNIVATPEPADAT